MHALIKGVRGAKGLRMQHVSNEDANKAACALSVILTLSTIMEGKHVVLFFFFFLHVGVLIST